MLELPSYVRLELKVIPQQRETPRRHDNKWIARRQTGLRAATSGNRETREAQETCLQTSKKY
jgi:hypothetical protein